MHLNMDSLRGVSVKTNLVSRVAEESELKNERNDDGDGVSGHSTPFLLLLLLRFFL